MGIAPHPPPVAADEKPYPDWVLMGSCLTSSDAGRFFFGVGSFDGAANNIRTPPLTESAARSRARNEVAKLFRVYSVSLLKDWMASSTAGDLSPTSEEQSVGLVIKTFTATALGAVEDLDTWVHPDGTVFAGARLDVKALIDRAPEMKELPLEFRDYVRENAERVHMDLEREEEKRSETD